MIFFADMTCLAVFYLFLADCSQHLPAAQGPKFRRWLFGWGVKGLLAPTVLWLVFNGAIFDCFPTFSPEVEWAKLSGHHLDALYEIFVIGLFIVSTYWMAVTSAWILTAIAQRAEERERFNRCVLLWSLVLGPFAALLTCAFGWEFAGLGGTLWFLPIIQRAQTFQPEPTVKPIYSKALAKLHFDKHEEAEAAVLEELEKCEDDFDGWMLLAELYASHFHDLPGAEDIIFQTCDHPAAKAAQVAVAFHRLADWHLHGNDPVAARRDLWEICRRFPRSHLDHMARLRLEHVPASAEELAASRTPKTFHLPEHRERALPNLSRDDALSLARLCIERLKKNPDDTAQREDLARLFTDHLNSVDRGLEQLELLLAMPHPPEKNAARWLSLMADWQRRHKKDAATAQKLLQRIVRQYPETPEGFAAQSELNMMDAETRIRSIYSKVNLRKIGLESHG